MRDTTRNLRRFATCLFLLATMGIQVASAQTQQYSETTDFSGNAEAPTVLSPPLGVGENSISGSVTTGGIEPDVDYFRVQLPPETAITTISLSVTNFAGGLYTTMDLLGAGNSGQIPILGNVERQKMSSFTIGNTDAIIFRVPDPAHIASFDYTVYIEVVSTAPPGPTLRIDLAGQISWNAQTGDVYQVQWTDALGTNDWTNLGGPVTAAVDTVTVSDDISAVPARFYRLTEPTNP